MFRDFIEVVLNDVLGPDGVIVTLKVYSDRGSKAGGVMCVASAAFEPFRYELFLHEWQPILNGWGASAFHATDFYTGGGQFKRKRPDGTLDPERVDRFERDAKAIPHIIGRHIRQLFVASVHVGDFEAMAPPTWRRRFGTVHRVIAQLALGAIGHWAKREDYDGDIAYFYEAGDEDEAHVHDAFVQLYADPVQRAHTRMAATPIGVRKGKAHGLEVADFLAWHWNKFYTDRFAAAPGKGRPMRKDIGALMEMLRLREQQIDVRLFTRPALEKFLIAHGCRPRFKLVSGGAA